MRIHVCLKEIQNPEISASIFKIDEEQRVAIPLAGLPLVTSPFDEQAIEAALRIRDKGATCRITALSFGPDTAQRAIKRALSMGVDDGILVADAGRETADSMETAYILAAAIKRAGDFDLILTGRQAADWDAGIVGCGVAELLRIPVITFAMNVEVRGSRVVVERVLEDGSEIVEAPMPCVVTVSNELGEPRKASLRETMRAAKKPIEKWTCESIGITPGNLPFEERPQQRERLFIPTKDACCEMVTGASPDEVAKNLVSRLATTRLI